MSFLIQAIDASDNTILVTISDISDISVIERQPRSAKPHTHYQLGHKSNVIDHTLSPPHDEWALANLSVKKQLDFADSDVEILDLDGLDPPHTPPDDNDLPVDTIPDWPETHSSPTHTLATNLGSLLSAQAALNAATLAGKFPLTPPSYTAEGSDNIDGLPVQDDPHGSTVSLDLAAASDTTAGTAESSAAAGTTDTGDTDLGLATAASGT